MRCVQHVLLITLVMVVASGRVLEPQEMREKASADVKEEIGRGSAFRERDLPNLLDEVK